MSAGVEAVDFGRYRLLPRQRLLMGGGVPVPLGGRAFDILVALVERRKEVVTKEELMRRVWGGQAVEENTLAVHLSALRKVLGDGKQGNRFIRTVPGRGYQFLAQVEVGSAAEEAQAEAPSTGQLPRALGALIGREAVLASVVEAVRARPLVTVTGAGGIGKTRLAVSVGEALMPDFPDGVWWIDLSPVGDSSLVAGTVARTLGLQLGDAPLLPRLKACLRGLRRLLILDNCEHVAAGVAELAVMLRDVEGVRLLSTSQEPLGVAGEQVERLERLAVPDATASITEAMQTPAVQLFMARAQAVAQDFALDQNNVDAVVRICRRLEGVPLALELAAARVALLSAEPVARRLDERLLDLSSGRRDILPKHQTLRALLAWSYGLLSSPERVVLRRLAVFTGGCTLEAAEAVVGDTAVPDSQVAEHLASLIAKSLVIAERAPQGARYRLLETTRAYASERLAEAGELPEVMRRHARYLCSVFHQADAALEGMAEGKWAALCWPELDNLRTALDWCFATRGMEALGTELTALSCELWRRLGDEGRRWIDTAHSCLEESSPPDAASALWLGKYWAALNQTDVAAMSRSAETALALARQSQNPVRVIRAALAAQWARVHQGKQVEADELLQETRQLAIKHSLTKSLVQVEANVGVKCLQDGMLQEAEAAFDRAHTLNNLLSDDGVEIAILGRQAILYAMLGDFGRALTINRRSILLSQKLNDLDMADKIQKYLISLLVLTGNLTEACEMLKEERRFVGETIDNLSIMIRCMVLQVSSGRYAEAAHLYGFIGRKWPHLTQLWSLSGEIFKGARSDLGKHLSENDFAALSAEGAALSPRQAQLLSMTAIDHFIEFVETRATLL